jgi:uncharacterized protein YoxC
VIQKSKLFWLKIEQSYHYSRLSQIELEAYGMHTLIMATIDWTVNVYLDKIEEKVEAAMSGKKEKLTKKLNALLGKKNVEGTKTVVPERVDNFVVNESTCTFTENELELLNKGLNFVPDYHKRNDIVESVVDVETVLKTQSFSVQNEIRKNITPTIQKAKNQISNRNKNSTNTAVSDIITSLKNKNCVYMKADKGNKLVILDKTDYEERMNTLITDSQYTKIKRSPLSKMVKDTTDIVKEVTSVFGRRFKWRLKVSNPQVPMLYGLPKIHKPGNKMRPILSNVNAPTSKLAKWVVKEVNELPPIQSLSVKNSFDFVEKIKEIYLEKDECMVSFDVVSLFPSVPVEEGIKSLEEHLIKHSLAPEKIKVIVDAAKLCMAQNIFQFRNKFYKIEKGTCMGNSLSPLIAECFMSSFEMRLQEQGLLPRVWHRYVDDVFAIVKKDQVNKLLEILNSQYESIKFTLEMEQNGSISFLDLKLTRVADEIDVSVYHKETSTLRYITNDSHSPIQHKMAAFNSLIHRLCSLPLSVKNYMNEYQYILEAARVNGYKSSSVEKLVKKHSNKVKSSRMTTFFHQQKQQDKKRKTPRATLNYYPAITNKVSTELKKFGFEVAYTNKNKLRNLLGSTKDSTEEMKKPGIYEINCQNRNCNSKYFGQTKRCIGTRFKEHISAIKSGQTSKSSVALHAWNKRHLNISKYTIKLKKHVTKENRLDAYESYYIKKNPVNLNADNGNITSPLFSLV